MMTSDLLNERAKTHGDFGMTGDLAQTLKRIIHKYDTTLFESGHDNGLTPAQHECLDMICTKISRIISGDATEQDHWKDIAGYAELGSRHGSK